MKREAACLKIQTNLRGHLEKKKYTTLKLNVIILQAGLRGMAARKEFRYRRQTEASIVIQVGIICLLSKYKCLVLLCFSSSNKLALVGPLAWS